MRIDSVSTCEMHTCGEPLRIVECIEPEISFPHGSTTLLGRINHLRSRADNLRRFLVHEPRGHHDMYAVLLVPPDDPGSADTAVIFMHNEGYSTMCGHAVLALGRYLVDTGRVQAGAGVPEVLVKIQCPCGIVTVHVNVQLDENGVVKTGAVRFESVPAFLLHRDLRVSLIDNNVKKTITFDISFGGAFYALVSEVELGVSLKESSLSEIVEKAARLKDCILADRGITISHPSGPPDLNFLYGVIVTDICCSDSESTNFNADAPTQNLCIFADNEVDRSPTGSGVTARVAAMYARGLMQVKGPVRIFENSVLGGKSRFTGQTLRRVKLAGGTDAVIVEVTGRAFYCGRNRFTIEADDPFEYGFKI